MEKNKPQMVSLSNQSSLSSFDTPPAEINFYVDLWPDMNISSSTPEFSIHLGRGCVWTIKEYQSINTIPFQDRLTKEFLICSTY
ncbi:hypothetical protein CDAR_204351 [Caerostris darwini]|uniref:Uncharacterized protein n=1 Tax=Caerostris darwini TaxID=1538125 RepID=A0AAV4UT73_9ARAC|nr:hypothetical protein CDAR_204351 [Caerostris darwini]